MFRFRLTALLLCAYFASQLAVVPHVHGVEPGGHGLRQHIHLAPASKHFHSQGDHSHGHPHGGSHSHSESQPVEDTSHENHDDGCIYLPDPLQAATQAKVHSYDFAKVDAAVCMVLPTITRGVAKVTSPVTSAPPNVLRHGCDLCVTLRMLRI